MSARDISDVAQEPQVLDNALFSLEALANGMAISPTALAALFQKFESRRFQPSADSCTRSWCFPAAIGIA
jgi:hypothetical protein